MIKKILIANRGEIALRIIRTCHEMGLQTVAVYSTVDRDSLHVRFSDEAVCIGPPPARDSYLRFDRMIAAAEVTGADAIHPGYGFLSENPDFSAICQDHYIKFIGPPPETIRMMGDKSYAKITMKEAGLPVIPGSEGIVRNISDGRKSAAEIGYPVIVKATAGGGGRGMRIVWSEEDFAHQFETAGSEAEASFGDGSLYVEKFIEQPRHIEIQILADSQGNVIHLAERECSIQRRHQKLIEEAPGNGITKSLREKMGKAAIAAANAVGYQGAGTCEFLLDSNNRFYFLEMNTRVQVEHAITEAVTGVDIV
ncbi:MAG: ATP-grasp domain-containing protein, partial [Bacteroidetes bacterium]|nr:ATP-grasp domain-containing protein [Bacteroidota bacterium]